MKVLHINSYYSDSKLYKNIHDRQIDQGIDLNVFVSVPTNYEMPKRDFGEYTVISKNHSKWDRIWYQYKQIKMLKDLKKHYAVAEYDLMHAHSLFTNGGLAYKIHKENGTDYIVAVRNTDVNSFFKKMPHLRSYGLEILEHAKKIIFISNTYKEIVINKYVPETKRAEFNSKIVVMPNGIDQYWLENSFEKPLYDMESKKINLIYVGKVMKLKNVPTIASACKVLQERGFQPHLTIIGQVLDISEFNKIKNESFITYKGFQPMEEIIKDYRMNDIFVMPSLGETFGLVYVEAMSQGLPVIYTKGQGFDGQFLEGEVGYHIDPKNPEDIADKIIKIRESYNEISKNSTKNALRFDWDIISKEYYKIYQGAIRQE